MVSLMSLWLPILLSAVLVFAVSSIIHMVFKYHNSDHTKMPGEENILEAMRKESLGRGEYVFPCPADMKDMGSPEMLKKYEKGPVGFMTVGHPGAPGMGASLAQWFVYSIFMGILVAYVASRTLGPGAEYLAVFRVAGAVAFIGYAASEPVGSIWWKRKWKSTFKHMLDGLLYALVTAGAFGWLWPSA